MAAQMHWNYEKRKVLEGLLKQGKQPTEISYIMMTSKTAVYTELRKGLSESDYQTKHYVLYKAERSTANNLAEDLPDTKEEFDLLYKFKKEITEKDE